MIPFKIENYNKINNYEEEDTYINGSSDEFHNYNVNVT